MDRMDNGNGNEHEHEHDFESPFLDRLSRYLQPEGEDTPSTFDERESPFAHPFVSGETEEESPFLSGERATPDEWEIPGAEAAEGEFRRGSDPSLFDPAELEAEEERWLAEAPDEFEAYAAAGEAPGAALFGESEGEGEGEGEIVFLRQEAEEAEEGEEEGEIVFTPEQESWEEEGEVGEGEEEWEARPPAAPSRVRGRILWPALGFPAVIAPRTERRGAAPSAADATRCITVLVLTDQRFLSKRDAARYLRIVPWDKVGRRHIPAGAEGSFREEELSVRNDAHNGQLSIPEPKGSYDRLVKWGETSDGEGAFAGTLSDRMLALYRTWKLAHLHEIRVSEEATARLATGTYHVFWNNHLPNENAPSDEMALLLERFVKPRRKEEGSRWAKVLPNLVREYEYEYGPMHLPYSKEGRPMKRAEIFHPVFVQQPIARPLRVGHMTDLHVDVRSDVYEFNLKRNPPKLPTPLRFNNWNTSTSQVYERVKRHSDIVLMTGDLVDYGRGHIGISGHQRLGENAMYHRDRNWLLFQDLIASADRYTVPAYTSLGNHDWRINPYPAKPLFGAPGVPTLVHNYADYDETQQRAILAAAHGDGYAAPISYDSRWKARDVKSALALLGRAMKMGLVRTSRAGTLNVPGLPTETSIESVIWYLLQINPFLDYQWSLPSGHRLLMLDWGQHEAVLFPIVKRGLESAIITVADFAEASGPGPRALHSLLPTQHWLVKQLVAHPSRAKLIGMHTPPIAPYSDWTDADLAAGVKRYDNPRAARGPVNFGRKENGTVVPLGGHPIYAIRPKPSALVLDTAGMAADYNSFLQHRDWMIRTLADPKTGIRAVLSGHIHRNGLFGVRVGEKGEGAPLEGNYLVQSFEPRDVVGGAANRSGPHGTRARPLVGALYLNTTSAGLRGNRISGRGPRENVAPGFALLAVAADGRITSVGFDHIESGARAPTTAPVRATREVSAI